MLDGEYVVYGRFETPVILEDAELIEFFCSEEDELPEYEARLTPAGRTYARKLKDALLEQYSDKYNAYLEADRKYLIRLYYGEKLIAAQIPHAHSLRFAEYIDFPKHDDIFHTHATLTEKGKQWVESNLEPLLITEQLLTLDEIDDEPVLRFVIPTGNGDLTGWIEIEKIYKDTNVILAIHTKTEAALDFTEFFDSATPDRISKYPDGTRRFDCNGKVAYAFFKRIMEKPVLLCGVDIDEG